MPALICLRGVQERVLVFLLIAAALGVSVVVVGVVCLDFGGPGIVFAVVAASIVGVFFFGIVGHNAFTEELVHVIAGDGGG